MHDDFMGPRNETSSQQIHVQAEGEDGQQFVIVLDDDPQLKSMESILVKSAITLANDP